jgi:hypothetical protein
MEGVDIWGDARDAAPLADPDALTLPPGLPIACARDNESRRQTWERLRREARAVGMTRKAAIAYASREVDRLHPHFQPLPEPEPPADPIEPEPEPVPAVQVEPLPLIVEPPPVADQALPAAPTSSGSGVEGLGDLPTDWPTLPANASLAAEIAWTQANRLRVRQGEGVDLSRALSPAPSYAALSWLETSILYPAKFADVTVKASGDQDDDKEDIRREKLGISELRTLLSEARGNI